VKGKIREKSAIGGDILGAAVPAMVVWRYMVFDSRSCEVSEGSLPARKARTIRSNKGYYTKALYILKPF
jgi:hypothetical protein